MGEVLVDAAQSYPKCQILVPCGQIRGYDAVAKLPKPFGFTEFGPHGPHNPPGDYDYTRFIDGVQKHFPRTTFFLAWHNKWSLGRNHNAKQLLEHPWLVNREDLPGALTTR